jgi:hypothetical protein
MPEITPEEHAAYLDAVAERDRLRAACADWRLKPAENLAPTGDSLVDRLRGIYTVPVNDGAGPLNGVDTFARAFSVGQIQHEAADEIEHLRDRIAELEHKYAVMLNESAKANAESATAPDRIVLDQGPPTEPGWYFLALSDGWLAAEYIGESDIGHVWTREGKWSRPLRIEVPE